MASWTPVIAFWKWGSLETVIDGVTGIFFENQTVRSLNNAIDTFESMSFDAKKIREHALQFDKKIFQEKILKFINEKLK